MLVGVGLTGVGLATGVPSAEGEADADAGDTTEDTVGDVDACASPGVSAEPEHPASKVIRAVPTTAGRPIRRRLVILGEPFGR